MRIWHIPLVLLIFFLTIAKETLATLALACFEFSTTILGKGTSIVSLVHFVPYIGICSFVLQGIGDNSQGFVNFLLFCLFTEKFQARLGLAAHNLLLHCKKPKSAGSSSVTESSAGDANGHQAPIVNERSRLLKST